MGLGLDIGSFLTGVQERGQEYDEDLATRIKELSERKPNDKIKTKYEADYKKYLEDKDILQAVTSARAGGDEGLAQQLLGRYKTMEDYQKALAKNPELFYETFSIGEEPDYTLGDYGLTNVRSDGSQITTSGRMFDQFFRPEVHEARSAVIPPKTEATYTTYRRGKTERTAEDIEASRASVKASYEALISANKLKDMPEKIDHYTDDGKIQSFVKTSDVDSEQSKAAFEIIGVEGYMAEGVARYTDTSKLAQGLRDLGPKPNRDSWLDVAFKESEDTPMSGVIFDADKEFAKVLEDWTYQYNTLIYGEATAHTIERQGRPDKGTIISGIYNEDGKKVSIEYTENPEHIFMEGTDFEKIGWTQVGGVEIKTPVLDSTIEIHNATKNTMQKIRYAGGDASFTDHLGIVYKGYEKLGDPKAIKEDSISLQTTYNDQGQEIKVYFTGNPKDNANGDIGWKQVGKAKAVSDNWSFKDAMEVIDTAIGAGVTINERQYEQGRFSFMQGENALAMEMSDALASYDKFVIMVRDFKFMKVDEVKDGKPTGERIPATAGAIEAVAAASGKSVREVRLRLLESYNARINK